jgi:hypothetical protein
MCSLRLPRAYLEELRKIAVQHGTSAGGAVMLLVDAQRRQNDHQG